MILTHSGIPQVLQFELATFFYIGRVGGVHCLGMCGLPMTMYSNYPAKLRRPHQLFSRRTTFDSTRSSIWDGRYVTRSAVACSISSERSFSTLPLTVGESVRAIVGTVGKRVPHDALPIYQLFSS